MKLPIGWVLLCGWQAFSYVLANISEGLSATGRLTPLVFHQEYMKHKRENCSTYQLTEDCDPQVSLYSESELVAAAFWTPGVRVAVSHHTRKRTRCALGKYINCTSQALTALNTEMTQVREAALENRAAIDYLVLRHNQGCEEFKGMCWFNLSNNFWLIENKETTKKTSHKCYRDRRTRFLLAVGFMAPHSWT